MKVSQIVLILFALLGTVYALQSDTHFNEVRRNFTNQECLICRFSVSLVAYSIQTGAGSDFVADVANRFCNLANLETSLVCSNITKLFRVEITRVIAYGLITPDQICGILSNNTCGHYHNPMSKWEVNLNASFIVGQDEETKRRKNDEFFNSGYRKPYKIIHISDTHVDLKYKQGSAAKCDEPLCCREASRPIDNNTIKAGAWGSYANCDIPLSTLDSTLRQINKLKDTEDDFDYIIWTGDLQPHDVWLQNKNEALTMYRKIFSKIYEHFPNITIFPSMGNHEMVPVDSFSPSSLWNIARDASPEWLYKELDGYWSRWLPRDTSRTITRDGFYATTVREGLKIVSINTNFCHNKNFWLYINSTDPGNQLEWLIHELQISEFTHEKVHIIGHIPPGGEDCLNVWAKNYNRIVSRFRETITGQFFGHTHADEFQIFYDRSVWDPISVGFVGPSVTTFSYSNPAFRIYTIDPNSNFMPVDFVTHYMNLTSANECDTDSPEWSKTDSFTGSFSVKDTSPASMHEVLLRASREFKQGSYKTLLDLFKLYNSMSDARGSHQFDLMRLEEKRKFLCKYFTSMGRDQEACDKFVNRSPQSYSS